MENGKRIAKIVILAIAISAIMGITAIEATTFNVTNCPECPKSEIALTGGYDYTSHLRCSYQSFDIPSIKRAYGTIDVFEYNNSAKPKTSFENIRLIYAGKENKLNDNEIEIAFYDVIEEGNYIRFFGYFLHIERNILIEVYMGIDTLGCPSAKDIEEAKTRFQELAKCAHSITGWKDAEAKEEYTLTLEQYPAYYEPEKGNPWRAGDLVATLKDKNGKGVSGKKVFFYVEPDTNLRGVLGNTVCHPHWEWTRIKHNFPNLSYFGDADTNNEGIARFNYLRYRCVKADILSERIRDTGENIKGPVVAAVFNQELTAIEQDASVVVEFSSVARITTIKSLNEDNANVSVTRDGKETEDVYDRNDIPKGGLPTRARCTPYDLLCGDVILLDENDYIKVHWLTGTKMSMHPKRGFLKEDQFAEVHIGGHDPGWREKISQMIQSNEYIRVGLTTSPFIIGLFSTPAGGVAAIPELSALFWDIKEPLIIEYYSTILIDFDETATVYTVEGTGRLHNIEDNSTTNVTTGHKMSVSPDGTFSQVSKFDRSELSEELSYVLDEIEGKPHKPTPSVGLIHNIDSGEDFLSIQDAVDDSDTKSGDTITVDPGIYVESVLVYKELTIQSVEGMNSTTVHGNGTHAFNVTTNRVKISGFSIESGGRCGIHIADANDCIISNNTVSGSHQGIYMLNSNRNMISGNSVWSNDKYGIILTKSSYNEIRNNNVNFNDMRGIGIRHGNENRITDNVMEENAQQGIYVYNSSKNKINDNTASGCLNRSGIELSHSNDNEIRNNTANANNHQGIGLWTSNENIIANNTVKDNRLNGIYVRESEHNVIAYNDVSHSVHWHGIYIHLSNNNEIENNVVSSNNMDGVKFEDSDENTLADNAIKGNGGFGIYLNNASINNVFLNDVFDNTKGTADFINANTIWSSTSEIDYTYNGKSYTSKMGNHWIDYTGTDANGDGIGDVPYVIGGIDSDDYALMSSRENYFRGTVQPTPEPTIFDTGEGGYPSVAGTHKGKITPSSDITLNGVYAYPCEGTNGHIKSIQIYEKNRVILDESISKGKLQTRREQWWKFMDKRSDGLKAGVEYNYIIETSSYPQMIHTQVHNADGGSITCDEFVDVNGKVYNDWIPAFKLE